ncbi:C40 family peptidase [Bifidobacterium sp. ESL0745]|uniref:C40 family peptidase n=1 Tax=Bifidobacterium sp. ESL0745 TaxID=2983226 RepID=UPI0023F7D7CB|nr:C40 family peptidase [Bifidobacterium sp. ESL0745]MDF7665400.1 C40 family peptidase [Bifidobacterium sp. ESL0745]
MLKASKICASLAALALSASAFCALSPSAFAANEDNEPVTSSRSFRKVNVVRKDLLKESTSTDVDAKSDWGGIESLDVPQTQSQAEKDAVVAQQRAAEAAATAAANAAAASRSQARAPLAQAPATNSNNQSSSQPQAVSVTPPNGESASALVSFAMQFDGKVPYLRGGNTPAGWDCSGFVQYVFGQMGIALPRTSGDQATAGRAVPDLSQAMPGDILASSGHAAIYIGNGQVINALNPGKLTSCSRVVDVFKSGYAIRRVL